MSNDACRNVLILQSGSSNARVAKAYWRMTMRWYTVNHAIWFYILAKLSHCLYFTNIKCNVLWTCQYEFEIHIIFNWHVTCDICDCLYKSQNICIIWRLLAIVDLWLSLDSEHKSPCKPKHVWEIKGSYDPRIDVLLSFNIVKQQIESASISSNQIYCWMWHDRHTVYRKLLIWKNLKNPMIWYVMLLLLCVMKSFKLHVKYTYIINVCMMYDSKSINEI